MIAVAELGRELRGTMNQSLRTLRFLLRGERLALATAVALMAGVGFLTAAIPLTLGELVDALLKRHILQLSDAFGLLGWLAGAYILREVLQVARKVIVEGTCAQVESRAGLAAVATLLRLDLGYFGEELAGSVNGRLNRSVAGMVKLLKLSFLDLFPALFGASFALIAAFHKNLAIGAVMAGVIPVGLTVILFQLATQRGVRVSLIRSREQMDGTIVEQIGGIETVRAAHAIDGEIAKVSVISESLRRQAFRHHIEMAFFDAGKSLSEGLFHIAVITFAIFLALSLRLSSGDILAVSMLFVAVVTPMREVHRIVDEAHESALHAANFFELLDQPSDRSFATPSGSFDLHADPLIKVHELTVGYALPDGETRTALDHASLEVRRGEIVGLAGVSGSGKTTLARTLLRLAHSQGGSIRIGGSEISELSRADIRQRFGLVSQSPFLFAGTVAENIAFGSSGATPEQIRAAAVIARIDREIEGFPGGYNYSVGERGGKLSGGQKQRIALARVFLQDPPILILDEATAALDIENERAVMDAVSDAMKGRTVVMIAHRLSSLRRADRIIVFDKGKVVEEGTFDQLLARPHGTFARIVREEAMVAASSPDLPAGQADRDAEAAPKQPVLAPFPTVTDHDRNVATAA